MKDKDHVNILSDFFPKFLLKKLEKIGVEKPIFSDGGGNPPPPGTQRVKELGRPILLGSMEQIKDIFGALTFSLISSKAGDVTRF